MIRVRQLKKLPRLDDLQAAMAYLMPAVKNAARDRRRAKGRRRARERPLDDDGAPPPTARGPSPEELLIEREERELKRRRLLEALEVLTPKQRQVIELERQGLDIEAIAARLKVTPRAVRNRRARAIVRLREVLGEDPNLSP